MNQVVTEMDCVPLSVSLGVADEIVAREALRAAETNAAASEPEPEPVVAT